MPQKAFGRRRSTALVVADQPAALRQQSAELGEHPSAASVSRTARKSAAMLAIVGGLVGLSALGAVYALNAMSAGGGVAAQEQCGGQPDCVNRYTVNLGCSRTDEPQSVHVLAADAEAAERKAERYNRGCRVRSVVLLSSMSRSAASNQWSGQTRKVADSGGTSGRRAWRFRRR
jgi:hypothetical protein